MRVSSIKLEIDGDPLIYGCGFAVEHVYYDIHMIGEEQWGPVTSLPSKKEAVAWVSKEGEGYEIRPRREVQSLGFAIQALKTKLKGITKTLKSDNYTIYLTGKGNYRDEVATILPYKGNRDPSHKPVHYEALRKYMIDRLGAIVVEGYEADDAVSMAQYANIDNTIIVSIDKDLDMVPGWHYNPNKNEKYWVTEEEGIKFFYTQLLTGDRTDNILGIPGVGPVKAKAMFDGVEEEPNPEQCMYHDCCIAYEEYYKDKEKGMAALKENARLLWMSRKEPDDWRAPE